jgi:hypothetical protein
MRETTYILGIKSIKIDKKKTLFRLSQSIYIDKILKWFAWKNPKDDIYLFYIRYISPRICVLKHKLREMRSK